MASNYYFHRQSWSIDTTPPGTQVGPFTAVMVSLVMGGLFVLFLPAIGFALVGQAIAVRLARAVRPLFSAALLPQAAAGEAHILGRKTGPSPVAEGTLEELSKEIRARRERE